MQIRGVPIGVEPAQEHVTPTQEFPSWAGSGPKIDRLAERRVEGGHLP